MSMVFGLDHNTALYLPANNRVGHPRVFEDLIHFGTLLWIDLEHAAKNMTAFAGQQAKDTPRAANHFFLFGRGGSKGSISSGWFLLLVGLDVFVSGGAIRLFVSECSGVEVSCGCICQGRSRGSRWKREFLWIVTRRRLGGEELKRAVAHPRHLPGEAAEGHAAVNDGERPNVDGLGVVFPFIVDLGGEIGIRSNDTLLMLAFCWP